MLIQMYWKRGADWGCAGKLEGAQSAGTVFTGGARTISCGDVDSDTDKPTCREMRKGHPRGTGVDP